ncbi:hypothetical protein ACG7TL_007560 [Trametes sanguinea]
MAAPAPHWPPTACGSDLGNPHLGGWARRKGRACGAWLRPWNSRPSAATLAHDCVKAIVSGNRMLINAPPIPHSSHSYNAAKMPRKTRSGATFSPWAAEPPHMLRVPARPDAAKLLEAAVLLAEAAMEVGWDDVQDGLPWGHEPHVGQGDLGGPIDDVPAHPEPAGGPSDPAADAHGGEVAGSAKAPPPSQQCHPHGHLLGQSHDQVAPRQPHPHEASAPAPSKGARDKARFKAHRRARRAQEAVSAAEALQAAKMISVRRAKAAMAVSTSFSLGGAGLGGPAKPLVAATAYVGRRYEQRASDRSPVTKAWLLSQGFHHVPWDGRAPHLILDCQERVIGVLVGAPRDETWPCVMSELCAALEVARSSLPAQGTAGEHRRGRFAAIACGISYGGGQTEPRNRSHPQSHQDVAATLLANRAVQRVAGFASSALQVYAPRIHSYYAETMDALLRHHSNLRRNFVNSVFASATFNLGPQTVAYTHTDHLNLPAGLCAITALGSFNADAGGHLVLWDLKLVVITVNPTRILTG